MMLGGYVSLMACLQKDLSQHLVISLVREYILDSFHKAWEAYVHADCTCGDGSSSEGASEGASEGSTLSEEVEFPEDYQHFFGLPETSRCLYL